MVEQESYYLTLLRYIEANAFRANLSKKAQDWCYGSLAERVFKNRTLLHEPYIQLDNWVDYVNIPQTQKELDKVRNSVNRQAPIGSKDWVVKNSAEIWFIINLESKRKTEKREKVTIKVACLYYSVKVITLQVFSIIFHYLLCCLLFLLDLARLNLFVFVLALNSPLFFH